MDVFLTLIHVVVCFALIGIVLLQHGKGADMGAAFGGSSQTLFGSAGATTFLGKMTAVAAIVFMATSLGLGYLASNGSDSFIDDIATPMEQTAPAPMNAAPSDAVPPPAAPSDAAPAPAPAEAK